MNIHTPLDGQSLFGPAIHAVLPYIESGGDPAHITPLGLEVFLAKCGLLPKGAVMGHRALTRVLDCWDYINEVVDLADDYLFEPDMLGTRQTDMLLWHRKRLCLVEIKTLLDLEKSKKALSDGRRQLTTNAEELRRIFPDLHIHCYILCFSTDLTTPFRAEWNDILDMPPV